MQGLLQRFGVKAGLFTLCVQFLSGVINLLRFFTLNQSSADDNLFVLNNTWGSSLPIDLPLSLFLIISPRDYESAVL